METLSIIDDLDLFFSYPWGRISNGHLIRGFRGHWERKFLDATEKKEKAVRYTVHSFPIAVQIWVFEAVPEIGDRFGWRLATCVRDAVPHRSRAWTTSIATLMPFDDRPVPALDDLARDSVAPQFHAKRLGIPEEGNSENETSDEAHEGSGTSGKEEESGADDSGEVEDYRDFADYAGHHPSRDDPDKDIGIDKQEGDGMCITEEQTESCPDEQDMPLPTGTKVCKAHIAHIHPCLDDHPAPVPTRIEEVQAKGGHHPSPGNRDEEQDMLPIGTEHLQDTADIEPCPDNDPMPVPLGTNEVQVLTTGARAGGGVTTTRRRSARLRCLAPATKTPYTRESVK
ncbi:Hypothetical predicted protein [Olea europaea subsp. europaea]|uniref:DUF1985 domain-containing protein n=1 Tax=Olea europaea subsp. europaea TaxID=158383 RepID=A0A8S0V2N4_OLEEU|nr:Hypothetical predicted protein [Olea europaea subsp. europaea]